MRHVSGLRQRKSALKAVKELDAFPKVPEGYQQSTAAGGGISILVFIIIAILVISEVSYYTATEVKYDYEVDFHHDSKLSINIDMTVAMKCSQIGADVLDQTGQNVASFGKLNEEEVYFDLSPMQRKHFDSAQAVNNYIRNEYHSLHKFLWRSGYGSYAANMPKREDHREGPKDGCRLFGKLDVNKVAGNFHVTAGKSVPVIPRGHAHLAMMVRESDYNFSHRIQQFSFGDNVAGRINPLDGEEKVIDKNYHMFQYFMQVVPTNVKTTFSELDTYQYAVTEQNRTIEHSKGSHGVPGIFVKYDLSPMKVKVVESHKPWSQFLIRLCGIVGGIFATSGMLHSLTGFCYDLFCCQYKVGKYSKDNTISSPRNTTSPPVNPTQPNSNNPNGGLLAQNHLQSDPLDLFTGAADAMASANLVPKPSLLAQDSFVREESVS